jgi:rhodanese-related sulfurtransferase
MLLVLAVISVATLVLLILVGIKRARNHDEIEQHSITAEELHSLLASRQRVLLFNVRQPLDLLAHPEIIPGAQRIAPSELLERPSLIPKEEEVVLYCTCPGEKTSREILHRALAMHFFRVKFLRGGLAAWKADGYQVEPYRDVFRLYDSRVASRSA